LRGELAPRVELRQLRRWRSLLKKKGDPMYLAPRTRFRGNRQPRVSLDERKVVDHSIATHLLTPIACLPAGVYRYYLADHQTAIATGILPRTSRPVSFVTFLNFCRAQDLEPMAGARGGSRAAHANAAPVPPEQRRLSVSRPFERAHIDHYLCDLHVVIAPHLKEKGTKRPWLTVARDEYTGAVLATSLSFLAPSRRSCQMVLRDCVRRHGRLPETITVDNGKEFGSAYFELLLARYGVAKQSRPPGAPRYGSSVERVFGSLKAFLRNLPGNTENDARGRAVSPKYRGQNLATLDIHAAYRAIEDFFFLSFNASPVGVNLQSPDALQRAGLEMFPCSGVPVDFGGDFLVKSAIALKRKLKVEPTKGIRHKDRWFVSVALLRHHESSVQAFEEPWNSDILYALVGDELTVCSHRAGTSLPRKEDIPKILDSILTLECAAVRQIAGQKKAIDVANRTQAACASTPRSFKPVPDKTGLPPVSHADVRIPIKREPDNG
jgi:putative transposase